jgi:hypothetical protein
MPQASAGRRQRGAERKERQQHLPAPVAAAGKRPRVHRNQCAEASMLPLAYSKYGLWCAVRRYSDAPRPCGASGTRYMTLRGLIGSRRVPSG